jgi:hypothetical protein
MLQLSRSSTHTTRSLSLSLILATTREGAAAYLGVMVVTATPPTGMPANPREEQEQRGEPWLVTQFLARLLFNFLFDFLLVFLSRSLDLHSFGHEVT